MLFFCGLLGLKEHDTNNIIGHGRFHLFYVDIFK